MLARKQHGVLTRGDLIGLGFSPKAIRHRLATGRLRRLDRGVYAVGLPLATPEQRWMAAVLSCGPGAVLSHRSAAALWGIGKEVRGRTDVSVRRRSNLRRRDIRVRERLKLADSAVTVHKEIPVTGPIQTLVDLAAELPLRQLERAVNEADKRDLVDPESLRVGLDDHAGEPGVRSLRRLLDRHTFRLSDTELEVLFRPIAARAGLPIPLTKQLVNGFEVDFYWPDLGLVVETDGWRYHRTPAAQSRDALRDQIHTAAGLTSLRFSHYQVKYERRHVCRVLSQTLANLRRS